MAGIEAVEEMTPEQLDAMAGGELLKGEVRFVFKPFVCFFDRLTSLNCVHIGMNMTSSWS